MRTAQTDRIVDAVAEVTGISAKAIIGPRRNACIAFARFLVVSLIRERFPFWSRQDIATAISRKDHATIIHALRRVAELRLTNPIFNSQHNKASAILSASSTSH